MANETHLEMIRQGVDTWNRWTEANPGTGADLNEAYLPARDLSGADLSGADLSGASLTAANLTGADLSGANLAFANLLGADLSGADLSGADLIGASLARANLLGADLSGADLFGVGLVGARIERAVLLGARVYGVSVWDLEGEPADQRDLVITKEDEPVVTVDNLKVAQFIYLLLSNPDIRDVIDTITSKVVLILGRFTDEREEVLDRLRDELRNHNLSPVLFDFEVPADRDITETVTLLARMARFVIADLSDPRSIPQELQAFVPDLAVPVQPIIAAGQDPWAMFPDLRKYPWMLEPLTYDSLEALLENLGTGVIGPAEKKRTELADRKQ